MITSKVALFYVSAAYVGFSVIPAFKDFDVSVPLLLFSKTTVIQVGFFFIKYLSECVRPLKNFFMKVEIHFRIFLSLLMGFKCY